MKRSYVLISKNGSLYNEMLRLLRNGANLCFFLGITILRIIGSSSNNIICNEKKTENVKYS